MGEKKLKKREEKNVEANRVLLLYICAPWTKINNDFITSSSFFSSLSSYVFRILSLCVSLSFPHIIMKNKCCKTTQGDH